jgi:hypothetical protein
MLKDVIGVLANLRGPSNHSIGEQDDDRGNHNEQHQIANPPKNHDSNLATASDAKQVGILVGFSR